MQVLLCFLLYWVFCHSKHITSNLTKLQNLEERFFHEDTLGWITSASL